MKTIDSYIQDKLINTNIQEKLVINSKSKAVGDDIYDIDSMYDLMNDKFGKHINIETIYQRFETIIRNEQVFIPTKLIFIKLTEENEQKYKLDYNILLKYAEDLNNKKEFLRDYYFITDERDYDSFIAFKYTNHGEYQLLFIYNGKDDINIFIIDQK